MHRHEPASLMAQHDGLDSSARGYLCPGCGGALWTSGDGQALRFDCRIGDSFSAAELWIEHSAARNKKLKAADRALAENAALARTLANWARERGNGAAARRLEQEAEEGEQLRVVVGRVLEGLPPLDGHAVPDLEGL